MIASYSSVTPLKARGGVPFRPFEIYRKESLFPAIPELLDELRLSGPDPRLEGDQRGT